MEFQELILQRQSDRKYSSKPVEKEKILKSIVLLNTKFAEQKLKMALE